jgi:hypothetical protein
MSLRSILLVGAAGAALTVPASAVAAPAVAPPTATLDACHAAPDIAGRYATFGAQMAAIPGTTQMSIRLELDERTPGDVFAPVAGVPGFGVWKTSVAGVGIFGYSQEVTNLTAPAVFKVTVYYRWLGAHRKVIKRAQRTTPSCNPAATVPSATTLVVGSLSSLAGRSTG